MAANVIEVLFKANTDRYRRSVRNLRREFNANLMGMNSSAAANAESIANDLDTLGESGGDALEGLGRDADGASEAIDGLTSSTKRFLVGAVGIGAVTVAVRRGVSDAREFSKAIGEVSTLVDTSVVPVKSLEKAVLSLASSYGVDQIEVASALYQSISAGASAGAQANLLLEVALKTAIGGVTDANTAVDGLTTVVNAFGKDMNEVEQVADVMFATMQAGKALDLETPIPTPRRGFVLLKDIKDGDLIFNQNGEVEEVIHAHDVIENAESYQVNFTDGTSLIACADHNWKTFTDDDRRRLNVIKRREASQTKTSRSQSAHVSCKPTVKTTKEILEDFTPKAPKLYKHRHYVQLAGAVQFNPKYLTVDPYLLGLWLGDGASSCSRFSTIDLELIKAFTDFGFEAKKVPGDNCDYSIKKGSNYASLPTLLREDNLLNNKHIPSRYHTGSITQRLALLRGLMDSDGHIQLNGSCEFVSVTKDLAYGVKRLVDSLGMRATIATKKPRQTSHKLAYRVWFSPTKYNPFNLQRKRDKVKSKYFKTDFIGIESIEKVEDRPMRCLTVTGDESLYLAGNNFIVTHNTTIGELSSFLFQAAPLAAALGVSFEEVSAAAIGMTKQGTPTSVAMTSIRAAMQGITKPSKELNEIFQEAGFISGEVAIRTVGLAGTFGILNKATGGSSSALTKLLGSIDAVGAVLQLSGDKAGIFEEAIGAVAMSSGAANEAFEKMQATLDQQLNESTVKVKDTFIALGQALTPVVLSLNEGIVSINNAIAALIKDNPQAIAFVAKALIGVTVAIATLGIGKLIIGFTAATLGANGLGAALLFLSSGGLTRVAVSLVIAAANMGIFTASVGLFLLTPLGIALIAAATGFALVSAAANKSSEALERSFVAARKFTDLTSEFEDLGNKLANFGVDDEQVLGALNRIKAGIGSGRIAFEEGVKAARDYTNEVISASKAIGEGSKRLANLEAQLIVTQTKLKKDEAKKQREAKATEAKAGLDAAKQALNAEEAAIKKTTDRAISLYQQAADSRRSTEDKIRELRRRDASDSDQQADIEAEAATKITQARRLFQAGAFDAARKVASSVQDLSSRLTDSRRAILLTAEGGRILEQAFIAEARANERSTAASQERAGVLRSSIQASEASVKSLQEALTSITKIDPVLAIKVDIEEAVSNIIKLERDLDRVLTKSARVGARTGGTSLVGFNNGGAVRLAAGGKLPGFGGGDIVNALLEPGEFVLNKEAVRRYGAGFIESLNSLNAPRPISSVDIPRFQTGGLVPPPSSTGTAQSDGEIMRLDLSVNNGNQFNLFGPRDQVKELVDVLSNASKNNI